MMSFEKAIPALHGLVSRRGNAAVQRRRRAAGGFLLLESLVGVALMAFVLSALPAGVVVSRQTVQKSADVVAGRRVAESVIANEFVGPQLQAGVRSGTLDGYNWSTLVRPRTSLQSAYPARGWTPYDVIVTVDVPNGRRLIVETIRLGRNR